MSYGGLYPPTRISPGYSSSGGNRMGSGARSQSNAAGSRGASSTYGAGSGIGGSYGSSGSSSMGSGARVASKPAASRTGYNPSSSSITSDYHTTRPSATTTNGTYGSGSRFDNARAPFGATEPRRDSIGRSTPNQLPLSSTTTVPSLRGRPGATTSSYVDQYHSQPAFERSQTSTQDDYRHSSNTSGNYGSGGVSSGMGERTYSDPPAHSYTDRLQDVYAGKLPTTGSGSTSTGSMNHRTNGGNRTSTPLLPETTQASTTTPRTRTSRTPIDDEEYDYYGSSDAFKTAKKTPNPPPSSTSTTSNNNGYAPQLRSHHTSSVATSRLYGGNYAPLPQPFGLRNLGNTCYLNATLQCILHTPGFVELCAQDPPRKSRAPIVEDMKELVQSSRPSTGPLLSSIKNKTSRINPEFSGFGQNDGHEFLRAILLGVHEEINRSRGAKYQEMKDIIGEPDKDAALRWKQYHKLHDDSAVYDSFGGQLRSVTKCCSCGHRSLTFDPILDVSVPMTRASSTSSFQLLEMLHAFSLPEDLQGTNKFHCPKCKSPKEGKRQTTISAWPRCLVVHFKRFSQSGSKNGARILYKEKLEVPAMLAGISDAMRDQPDADELQPPEYRLRGVVIHHGSSGFGHYTSYVHNAKRGWNYCDDGSVRSATIEEVLGESSGAYILFYEAVGPGKVAAK